VQVRKILTMVGLGTIFSDIMHDNPTIKTLVGERAFPYIISSLSCVRRFTNSQKTMCGCTPCTELATMHRSLQAKRGLMHRQISIDLGRRTTKVRAAEMARGWGEVGWHPTPGDAIAAGTCTRWRDLAVPHWDCQTMNCTSCRGYPCQQKRHVRTRAQRRYVSTFTST
jgi:hypothetical protein